MKKLFAIILLLTLILTTAPVMAKHHTPHRYAKTGRNYKQAGAIPRYNDSIEIKQYSKAMSPNYNTKTHPKYNIATAPNYKNQMSINYKIQMSPNYKIQMSPNHHTQTITNYYY